MKRFISLFIVFSFTIIIFNLFAVDNSENIIKSQEYLQFAKNEIEKGNFEKAKIYLDNCLELNPKNKEVKALYLKIKNKERKSAKLKTPLKKFKTLAKEVKIPVKEVKEILVKKEKAPVNRFEEYIVKIPENPRKEKIEYTLPAERKFTPRGPKTTILWEDFNSGWGLYGDNPPAGWTIIDNGDESPATWNENDWYRYYYDAVQDSVARVYWSPSENQEEWLITPTLNIPAETCSLKFWHYYWDCDLTDSAYVLGSTNNGSSWTETIALFSSDHLGSDTAFDITSWASGVSQVKIAFLYYGDYDWYWMVDNCSVATYVTYTYDVGVTAILQPPDSVPQGRKTWTPRAVIRNFGTEKVKDFDVICTFQSNNTYADTVTIGSWLNPGISDTIIFSAWDPQVMGTDTMTVYHNGDLGGFADENNSNDTLANQVKIVRSYFTGGPDAFSYRWIDSDTTGGPAYAWIDESGATAIGFASADAYVKVALPFNFMFYENSYDSVFIGSNGYVSFGDGYTAYSNVSIPSVGTPNNAIYAFWDDLNPSSIGAEVYYKSIANGFVVIWKDVPHYSNVGAATFEIILNDNGSIVLQYQDVNFEDALYDFGMSATVGIENSDGSTGLEYEYNGSPYGNLIFDGRAIQFECVRDSYDVAVSAIPLPPDSVPQGRRTWAPRAVLTNFGTEDVINFDVICSFKSNNIYVDTFTVSSWFNSFTDLIVDFSAWDPQIIGTDTMTVHHNLGSDEDRSNDTLSKPVKIVRSYFTGGPDGYGYSWIDSDTTGGPAYSWIASGGSTPVALGDDATIKVELPFPFRFYENVYDSIWICSNGFVNFGSTGYSSLGNTALPNTGTPNNAIYCFWDDLNPGAGGTVWYKTVGSTFIVCWDDVPRLGTTNGGSFQIILYDNGGIILQYADVNFGNSSYNFGRSATVGIENSGGSTGLQYMYDWDPFGNILFPQRAIDFPCDDKPSPPIIYPLYLDLDGDFPVYWTPSIDRDGVAAYQLDEVAPDTLLDDPCLNGIFDLVGFKRSNTRGHTATPSYGSRNVSSTYDTMTSISSYLGAQSVEFWWWGGIENGIDDAYFDISTDNGTSWINLGYYTGNDSIWKFESVDVSSYSGNSILLRYRYESDGSLDYGGFWVDDILVNGWQWVQTFSNSITDTTYNVTGASNGWHYYHARGKDNLNNWGNWGNIEDIWIGPNDAPTITIVQPATDTFITNPTDFTIKWTDFDTEHNAIVSIYYDTDNTGYDGILIQGNISEDDPADSVVWDMSSIYGTYYIYGKIDDGINAPVYSYSNGVVTHLDLPVPPADGLAVSNRWLYFMVDPDESLSPESSSNVLVYTVLGDTSVTSDDGVKLLFGTYPWSSGTTVRIDGTDYIMGCTGAGGGTITTPIHYISGSGPTEQQTGGNDGISYTMTFGDIEVKQDALLSTGLASYGHYDVCLLRYTVVNTSNNTDHTVGIRIHFDTMLDTQDGALIRVEGYPYTTKERLYDGSGGKPIPWYFWGKDSTAVNPIATTVSMGILRDYGQATLPDSFCVAQWTKVDDSLWTYPYDLNNDITDSDVIMWYSPRLLAGGSRGDTMVVATYYGSGPLNEDVPTAITLTEFTAAYIPKTHKIRVLWRTESEEDNLGFNVYRAIGEGEYVKLNKDIIEGAGNSSSPREYSLTDTDIKEIGIYHYKLEQIDLDGTVHTFGPASVDVRNYIPIISSLQSIFPNPFTTHSTSIPFVVGLQDGGKDMTIKIYNVSGRLVKTLVNGKLDPGYYSQKWDVTDNGGKKVSSGVYYTVLKTGETTKIKKMVLIK